ncbi:MAG: hypothetical protein ACXAEE_09830 [Candidatus Thorarchaeota archaeon]|jgi:hypothetical protein
MKRAVLLLIASLIVMSFSGMTAAQHMTGLQWSFEEGDFLDYRLISDGLVDDKIISFRIDSPLAEWLELPPDEYGLDVLDDWMEIPLVNVTAFIPLGGSTSEVEGFENIFDYGGLAAEYWCRFGLPDGEPEEDYKVLVEKWNDGPHGAIETRIIDPPMAFSNLYWGFEYGFEFLDTIYNVTAWYFSSIRRLANVTIVGHDSMTGAQTHFFMLATDLRSPELLSPDDINLTFGATGEEIRWRIFDYPTTTSYVVYRNGTLILSGESDDSNTWVDVSLDDLEVGVWNYTIVATDFMLQPVSDTVIVTIESSLAISSDILLIAAGIGIVAVIGVVVVVKRK